MRNLDPAAIASVAFRRSPCGQLQLVIAWLLAAAVPVTAQTIEAPRVVMESIAVTPASPGAETLCRLSVRIANNGTRAVYGFGFDVELNGQPLRVYEDQLFLQVIEAGAADDVALWNFWTSETGRPAPKDGRLEILVRLREARWVDVSEVEEDGETVEVWTPIGDVDGLPQVVRRTLEMADSP